MSKKEKFDFNAGIDELERLVKEMEQENLNLDAALKNFEKGITLVKKCQKELIIAEQKIIKLTREDDYQVGQAFNPD